MSDDITTHPEIGLKEAHAAGQLEAMTAVLFDYATHPDYRIAVSKEFEVIKAFFGNYQESLKKTYSLPVMPDPR